jgi:hypothetical protein
MKDFKLSNYYRKMGKTLEDIGIGKNCLNRIPII